MKEWFAANQTEILMGLCFIFAAFLVFDALWKFDKERRIKKIENRY